MARVADNHHSICFKCHQEGHFGRECTYEERPMLHHFALQNVIIHSTRITLQISACVLFMMVYQLIKNQGVSSSSVLGACWTTAALGQMIYQAVYAENWPHWFYHGFVTGLGRGARVLVNSEQFRVTVFYLVVSYFLAPVLRTLSQTISTDTIHALSIGLLFIHLLTNDYGVSGFLVSRTISINAAIIAAICLSSRLPENHHSMTLITLAIESFVLFPIFSSLIWDSSLWLVVAVSSVSYLCFIVSSHVFLLYIGSVAFITFMLPLTFVTSQKFKYNLYGPWDEAVVEFEG